MKRKVFIDCGGNKAQSIERFKKSNLYSPDYYIYSFEPDPNFAHKFTDKDVTFFQKAVWIWNGKVNFYVDPGRRRSEGSTLFKDKRSKTISKEPITVECIDLSKWIMDTFLEDDYIILKVDIEGSEYKVLNKMIEDGSIKYINKLFVEFHHHKIGSITEEVHKELVKKLKAIKGLELLPPMNKAI